MQTKKTHSLRSKRKNTTKINHLDRGNKLGQETSQANAMQRKEEDDKMKARTCYVWEIVIYNLC